MSNQQQQQFPSILQVPLPPAPTVEAAAEYNRSSSTPPQQKSILSTPYTSTYFELDENAYPNAVHRGRATSLSSNFVNNIVGGGSSGGGGAVTSNGGGNGGLLSNGSSGGG
ncbi:hypothetical protein HDU76_007492, partial [Blyttiomyces sp. JEL0837]